MSVYYLNADDFSQEGNHLVANIGGITFVMFHSQRCDYCARFLPVFQQLALGIRGVNFGLCCVDGPNRTVVQLSKNSTTPIMAVPKFILYNDGIPMVEYSGTRTKEEVVKFLQEIISKLDQKQSFTRPRRTRQAIPPTHENVNRQVMEGPSRPSGLGGTAGSVEHVQEGVKPYVITPNTGVKEYETSYGRPYNTLNESDFLDYQAAYKQQMNK
jgi:thiol-disulfide isomerase/thioredoxin